LASRKASTHIVGDHLRVLIANEREDRIGRVQTVVEALGHQVIVTSTDVAAVAQLTSDARPDVALVGLGDDSEHALQLIEQIARMEEALEIIGRLLDGERLDHHGRFFRTKAAYLYTRGERRPPRAGGTRRRSAAPCSVPEQQHQGDADREHGRHDPERERHRRQLPAPASTPRFQYSHRCSSTPDLERRVAAPRHPQRPSAAFGSAPAAPPATRLARARRLVVRGADRLRLRRAALAQVDRERGHRADGEELRLPVLQAAIPEVRVEQVLDV
jgi:CheY-like chemotaxis protein